MNTIRWIIAAAVSVLIGLTLTSWLREPIDNYFRSDRIEAELTVGPWVELPTNGKDGQLQRASDAASVTEIIRKMSDIDENFRTKPTNFSELTIENKSEKEISNIRIRFDSMQYRIAFEKDGDKIPTVVNDIEKIDLPNMKPGDKIVVQAWGNYTNYYGGREKFAETIKTYSSSGSFRIKANWSGSQDLDESSIDLFMNDWGYLLFVGIFVLLTIVGFTLYSLIEEKIKKILSDDSVYLLEKERYKKDPKKYNALEEEKNKKVDL